MSRCKCEVQLSLMWSGGIHRRREKPSRSFGCVSGFIFTYTAKSVDYLQSFVLPTVRDPNLPHELKDGPFVSSHTYSPYITCLGNRILPAYYPGCHWLTIAPFRERNIAEEYINYVAKRAVPCKGLHSRANICSYAKDEILQQVKEALSGAASGLHPEITLK